MKIMILDISQNDIALARALRQKRNRAKRFETHQLRMRKMKKELQP